MPTSAEAVAREPTLDEALDVPSVPQSVRDQVERETLVDPAPHHRDSDDDDDDNASFDTDIVKKKRDQAQLPSASEPPSLTVALTTAWRSTSWSQRWSVILASVAINVGLPFINGVMLGFGELVARNVIGVRLGWTTPFPHNSESTTTGRHSTTSTPRFAAGERHSASVHTGLEAVESAALAHHNA